MQSARCSSLVLAVLATCASMPPALAQDWSIAIQQNPTLTSCGAVSNIPVAAANNCPSAITAAQNLFGVLRNIPNCINLGCRADETAQMQTPTCAADPNVAPNTPARWQVGLRWTCIGANAAAQGLLKICKVAGVGVAVGTPFTFTAGSSTLTVPSGPAPGGTCMLGPTFPVGATVAVTETIPVGNTVTGISVAPPSQLAGPANVAGGSINVTIGSGVTEVTFGNKRTGFVEICKGGDVAGSFRFTVNPGSLGPFVVPAGACSPAIEVAAGTVLINELPSPGTVMAECSAIPPGNQVACNTVAQTSTVTVVPGNVATMTIASIANRPADQPGGPRVVEPTSVQLACTPNPAATGASVTCTARVIAGSPRLGTVRFSANNVVLTTAPVEPNSGDAVAVLANLAIGSHSIVAAYGGDLTHAPSVSAAVDVTVVGN